MPPAVAIPGLAQLRRDMRAINADLQKELRKAEVVAAGKIAEDAAKRAPKGTRPLPKNRKKRLSESVRVMPRGAKLAVGASARTAPHGNVVHWGGTIHPKGAPITFQRRPFIAQAFDANRDEFVQLLAAMFEQLAANHGFTP